MCHLVGVRRSVKCRESSRHIQQYGYGLWIADKECMRVLLGKTWARRRKNKTKHICRTQEVPNHRIRVRDHFSTLQTFTFHTTSSHHT